MAEGLPPAGMEVLAVGNIARCAIAGVGPGVAAENRYIPVTIANVAVDRYPLVFVLTGSAFRMVGVAGVPVGMLARLATVAAAVAARFGGRGRSGGRINPGGRRGIRVSRGLGRGGGLRLGRAGGVVVDPGSVALFERVVAGPR